MSTVTSKYSVNLELDTKVMQEWVKTNGDLSLQLWFCTLNYPTNNPIATAICNNFVINPNINGVTKLSSTNAHGNFSSHIVFSASTSSASSYMFAAISPNISRISFDLTVTAESELQIQFATALSFGAGYRIPTNAPEDSNFLTNARVGPIDTFDNEYEGEGTFAKQPVTGFKSLITKIN